MTILSILIVLSCGQIAEDQANSFPDINVPAILAETDRPERSTANADSEIASIDFGLPAVASHLFQTGDSSDTNTLMKIMRGDRDASWLDRNKISVSGWTNMSYTASTDRSNQNPMGLNYLANSFLLQQNWLRIQLPVDRSADHATFGFHSDTILPGSDYVYTLARGLFNGQLTANNGHPNRYGFDPVQFYAEAFLPNIYQGLQLKFGHFFAPFGAESVAAIDSPLGSRAYSFIYDPFTQTGLLGYLQVNDVWKWKSGIVMGNDDFINPAASPYYVGGWFYDPNQGRTTAEFTVIYGSGVYNRQYSFNNPQVFDLVVNHKFDDKTRYTLDALYGFQDGVPEIGFANWFCFAHYLTHDWADNLSSTLRLEFFDDIQGQRTGFTGLYTALTLGVKYVPVQWLWVRPEIRYDHNSSRPFEGNSSLFTADLDLIIRW